MTRLYLVRHGRAAASYDSDNDPGLDEVGRSQAEAMADGVAPIGPLPIVVSPLQRTRETAAPLEARWEVAATVEPAIGEIPAPMPGRGGRREAGEAAAGRSAEPSRDLVERGQWLRGVLNRRWLELEADVRDWRAGVVEQLMMCEGDTVVVTHFVAINIAIGAATDDDRVVCFLPDNCSVTTVETDGRTLRVAELGRQAETVVR